MLYQLEERARHLIFADDFVADVVDAALNLNVEHEHVI